MVHKPEAVENAITRKTRAIISVDMYGHPADKTALNVIAQEHNLPIIEDAAPELDHVTMVKWWGHSAELLHSLFKGQNLS